MSIFDWPVDKPVHEAIGEAIGAASVCWENPAGAGVFDSERAAAIADELEGLLRRKLWALSDDIVEVPADQWDRIAAVVRVTLQHSAFYGGLIGQACDALTAADIEAVSE